MKSARRAQLPTSSSEQRAMPANAVVRPAVSHKDPHVEPHATGPGNALESEDRAYFEPRFRHDFSRVRVHADAAAAAAARSEGSAAYTVGNDISFGQGMYSPGTDSGRRLLAHELTHVIQQENHQGDHAPGSDYEVEAKEAAGRIASGGSMSVHLAAPRILQRQELPELSETKLAESASPTMAAVIGSVTLDGFVTGKADLSAANSATLARTVENIKTLLQRYPASTIHVIGHTDAVGQEGDNQTLGESRAESVKAALQLMGIPEIAIHSESHGARELLVRTTKAEPHNRRVQVYFEPSLIGRHAVLGRGESSGGGTAGGTFQPGGSGTPDCIRHPEKCIGPGGGVGGSPTIAPLKSTPSTISLKGMDVQGINDAYISHGNRPPSGDDLRDAWVAAKKRYLDLGFSDERADWLANKEISSTASKEQIRDYPNSIDRSNTEMQRQFPGSTTIGPINIFEKKF
jgi:outer membrane protein OmpA-like peptidoglycan-associated protein